MEISNLLAKFLIKLLEAFPGKELGQNVVEFRKYLKFVGFDEVVTFRGEGLSIDEGKLSSLDLSYLYS